MLVIIKLVVHKITNAKVIFRDILYLGIFKIFKINLKHNTFIRLRNCKTILRVQS